MVFDFVSIEVGAHKEALYHLYESSGLRQRRIDRGQ